MNINKLAGSMLGFKHTDEAKIKFNVNRLGKTPSTYLKGLNFSKDKYPVSKKIRLKEQRIISKHL